MLGSSSVLGTNRAPASLEIPPCLSVLKGLFGQVQHALPLLES